jgi:transposase InsO family protein
MSLNSDKDAMGAGGSSSSSAMLAHAPRLGNGGLGYAAWRTNMDVYLLRNGAENIHSVSMLESKWMEMSRRSATWQQEALDEAMALVLGDANNSSSDSSSSSSSTAGAASAKTEISVLSDAVKAGRKVVSSTVERSRRVFGVLYSALPDDLKAQAGHIAQGWAYGLWHWLETKFQSTEEDSVGELLGQWSALRQDDSESFDSYRARVNKLHALLVHAKEKPSVRMYSHTLLDRLQPRYKAAVLALKASGQLKDADKIAWDTVTAFINAHEREEARIDGEAAVIMAARGAGTAWKKPAPWARGSSLSSATPQASNKPPDRDESSSSKRHDRRPMSEIQCYACDKFGHFARKCPLPKKDDRVEGHPGEGRAFGVGEHRQDRREASQEREQAKAVLSQNRFAVLQNHRESDEEGHRGDRDDPSSFKGWNGAFTIKAVRSNCKTPRCDSVQATTAASQHSLSALAWGMDSMASLHVSGNRALFTEMSECKPQSVEVADGSTVEARHVGNVLLSVATTEGQIVTISVKGVYYHERFSANLLSWNVLRAMGWEFHSTKKDTFVITPGGSKVMLSTHGRVSVMKNSGRGRDGMPASRVYALGSVVSPNVTDLMRLHEKLGHMGFDRMLRMMEQQTTLDVQKVSATKDELQEARRLVLECKACVQGKGARSAFGHRGLDKGVGPGETLHMDTFQVPMENEGRHWLEYGLAVTDPYTSHRWFEHLDSKDKAAEAVIRIVQNAQTQLNCRVKRLYADGGTEFINHTLKSFCVKQGIELHYPPARTQQLNGVAENSVRVIKDGMRSMMIHSYAPRRFWSYAGKHGVYVWNRTHTSHITGKTPYEVMFGKKPSVRSWGVFGCDAYLHVPKEQRDVFAPKMDPCIYLGHDAVQNCPTVYLLRTRKIIRSRDVSFRDTSFTHGAALTAGDSRVLDLLQDDGLRDLADLRPLPESDEAAPQGGRQITTPEPEDESNEYEVEQILAQRVHRQHGAQFLVKWSTDETTWEPAEMMKEDAPNAVEEFLAAHPPPSGPRRSPRHRVTHVSEQKEEIPAANASTTISGVDEDSEEEKTDSDEFDPDPQTVDDVDLEELEAEAQRPQVHMAMSALRNFHSPMEGMRCKTEIVHAVSSGVALLEEQTPRTVREAKASPDAKAWQAGMDKEMASCMEKKVWSYVRRADVPRGKVILRPKWVFKTKTDENGQVTDRKARITPRGFEQKPGSDYFEVFAPTGMFKSMRLNLSLAAKWDHELDQLDIPVAFLNAPIDEKIFMEIPEGYSQGKEHLVCVLNQALYGLKQSPRNWYLLIRTFIIEQ